MRANLSSRGGVVGAVVAMLTIAGCHQAEERATEHLECARHAAMRGRGSAPIARATYALGLVDDGFEFYAARRRRPARFRTLALTAGGLPLYSASSRPSVFSLSADVAERTLIPGIVERLDLRRDGVEQSWRLSRRPAIAGPVVVTVDVGGATFEGRDARGLRFRADGQRLRYGAWTARDARGRVEMSLPRFEAGAIILEVSADFVARATFPLMIDPLISAETAADQPIVVPVAQANRRPAVATDGKTFMAVWEDNRGSISNVIYGARVDLQGKRLDHSGIRVGLGSNNQSWPRIAYGGGVYLVVWQDAQKGGFKIYGSRIKPDGTLLDTKVLAVGQGGNQLAPAVAYDGSSFLVVWSDNRGGNYDIRGARVKADGTLLDGTGLDIFSGAGDQDNPRLAAANSGGFLVVWQQGIGTAADIVGTRVSSAGVTLNKAGITICGAAGAQYLPTVAFNGVDYLVAWEDYRNSGKGKGFDIYATRVSLAGAVQNAGGLAISSEVADQRSPELAATAKGFIVSWLDNRLGNTDIYFSRIDAAGRSIDSAGIPLTNDPATQSPHAVAHLGGTTLVVWQDNRDASTANYDIYAARVSSTAVVLDPRGILLSTLGNREGPASVAYNGQIYLVAWQDDRLGHNDIVGLRVGADGKALDKGAQPIGAFKADQITPSAASDGKNFFVVWADGRKGNEMDIFGMRLTGQGGKLDPSGGAIISAAAQSQVAPAVAYDQQGIYLVVWRDARSGNLDIYGARVDAANGKLLDPGGIPISAATGAQRSPTVAWVGQHFIVAWEDQRLATSDIYIARVDRTGKVLDPKGVAVTSGLDAQREPNIASDGKDALVVFTDHRNSNTGEDIYAARIAGASGKVVDADGFAIRRAKDLQRTPRVVYEGRNYLVAWQDLRVPARSFDIIAVRVSPAGKVIDAQPLPIGATQQREHWVALARGLGRQVLLSYSRAETAVDRLHLRRYVPCATHGDCDDKNACTDDVCDVDRGGCVSDPKPNGTACPDRDRCNGDEICRAGTCVAGKALDCDDNNRCTADRCEPDRGCVNTALPTSFACAECKRCDGKGVCVAEPGCVVDGAVSRGDAGGPRLDQGSAVPADSGGCQLARASGLASPAVLLLLLFLLVYGRRHRRSFGVKK